MTEVDAATPPRTLWDRLAKKAAKWRIARCVARQQWLAYLLMILLLLGALASLVGLNYLIGRLWGELVYGLVVTTVAVWALGHLRPTRWVLGEWDHPALSVPRAALWAAFAVVAIPIAILRGREAVIALIVVPVGWAFYRLVRHFVGPPPKKPRPWLFAGLGIVSLAAFLWGLPPILPHLPWVPKVLEAEKKPSGRPPTAGPENPAHAQLAWLVRPELLFDRGESRVPLDIVDAVRNRRVRRCSGGDCGDDPIESANQLDLGADYLTIEDVTGVRRGGGGSAYYYHVDAKARDDGKVYVDYWWYFTRNPSPVAAAVGCGPAARWVGLTCHDHPSDWEGVTVVLAPCTGGQDRCVLFGAQLWEPVAVRYAQHDFLVSYAWEPTLARLWRHVPREAPSRPLVYVAKDSHASYPFACGGRCKQYASYPLWRSRKRDEGLHDGTIDWRWNNDLSCIQIDPNHKPAEPPRDKPAEPPPPDCLLPLPITDEDGENGGLAASWNAFPGRWGTQRCIVAGTYCDTSKAPEGPSEQRRYQDPGKSGPWMCLEEDRTQLVIPLLTPCGDADPDEEIPT